uniref:DNA-directed primase/polymerase protein n=1 Tax=Kalanchoe fedtschenkoi TaxID=63787 RepID=A0A7N1A273_KALFE
MDDVDRLFECFKCGITPPQSALRERKRSKREPRHHDTSGQSDSPASVSVERRYKNAKGAAELLADKLISKSTEANKINSRKQFSPIVFYGSPRGLPPKRQSRLLRLLHEIRSDISDHSNLESPREVWATFPRQEEAINFSKEHQNIRIFSYQDHFSGQRRFLVSSYKEFWRRYKGIKANHRHHYEVILEGLPCHLYFDLEFSKKDNHDKNGDEMVDILIRVILEALRDKYSIHGCVDWIVELDSSTEDKFSRHLIIRVPGAAFKDNIHAGAFVNEICSRIDNAKDSEDLFQKLFICKDSASYGSVSQLFVDSAVYSRNRCFRLPLSSKAGKNSLLLPTGRFKCKDMCEEDMFMASLICNLDRDCKTLLVCKMDADCVKTLKFDTEVNQNIKYGSDNKELCDTAQDQIAKEQRKGTVGAEFP